MTIKDIDIKIIKAARFAQKKDVFSLSPIGNENVLRNTVARALKEVKRKKEQSIAFLIPDYADAALDFKAMAKIISQEVFRIIRENKLSKARKIILALPDEKTKHIFEKTVFGYLEYISKKLEQGPFVTVDLIIRLLRANSCGIVLIERSNPPFGWALPGGFVDYGESLEQAAKREAKEETSLSVFNLTQFHTYSDYGRDPRFHTVSTVFTACARGRPKANSDARGIKLITEKDLDKINFAFDHKKILKEYFSHRENK